MYTLIIIYKTVFNVHLHCFHFFKPIDKKSELWAPLAPQGWKPCIGSSGTSCKSSKTVRLCSQIRSLLFPCIDYLDGFVGWHLDFVLSSTPYQVKWIYSGFPWWWAEPTKNGSNQDSLFLFVYLFIYYCTCSQKLPIQPHSWFIDLWCGCCC